jgi:hypothetical protein
MRPGRQTRSFGYEQYPPRPSKKVRTALGRQIHLAAHTGHAQKHRLERCRQQLTVPGKGKRKTRWVEPAGQICPIGLSAGPKPRLAASSKIFEGCCVDFRRLLRAKWAVCRGSPDSMYQHPDHDSDHGQRSHEGEGDKATLHEAHLRRLMPRHTAPARGLKVLRPLSSRFAATAWHQSGTR